MRRGEVGKNNPVGEICCWSRTAVFLQFFLCRDGAFRPISYRFFTFFPVAPFCGGEKAFRRPWKTPIIICCKLNGQFLSEFFEVSKGVLLNIREEWINYCLFFDLFLSSLDPHSLRTPKFNELRIFPLATLSLFGLMSLKRETHLKTKASFRCASSVLPRAVFWLSVFCCLTKVYFNSSIHVWNRIEAGYFDFILGADFNLSVDFGKAGLVFCRYGWRKMGNVLRTSYFWLKPTS